MFTSATRKLVHKYAHLLVPDNCINGRNCGKWKITVVAWTN